MACIDDKRSVVVTGVGIVSPLGLDSKNTWLNMLAGKNAAKQLQKFDARGWPVQIACEVGDLNLPSEAVSRVNPKELSSANQYAFAACFEALANASLNHNDLSRRRSGIYTGTGIGALKPQEILDVIQGYTIEPSMKGLAAFLCQHPQSATLLRYHHPHLLSTMLARQWSANHRIVSISTACAGAAQAIGRGARSIANDELDVVVAGGADSLASELLIAGFALLGVLSTNPKADAACRPFDKKRDGLVASEGAAFLVLEAKEHALKRSAKILAELVGYGESENAYRLTDLPEDGRGAISAMEQAIGKFPKQRISCVNAHGTSTVQNDQVEARAIEKVFYSVGANPKITANKSQLGHLITASGAIEAAVSVLSLVDQVITPILNLDDPLNTAEFKLDYVSGSAVQTKVEAVLSNSFGFGGSNASLLFAAEGSL